MTEEFDETQVDLFEMQDSLPKEVADIVSKYLSELEDPERDSYKILKEFLVEIKAYNYEFDYGLDAMAYGLRRMKPREKVYLINQHGHYFSFDEGFLDETTLVQLECSMTRYTEEFISRVCYLHKNATDVLETTFYLTDSHNIFGFYDDRGLFNCLDDELAEFGSKEIVVAQYML